MDRKVLPVTGGTDFDHVSCKIANQITAGNPARQRHSLAVRMRRLGRARPAALDPPLALFPPQLVVVVHARIRRIAAAEDDVGLGLIPLDGHAFDFDQQPVHFNSRTVRQMLRDCFLHLAVNAGSLLAARQTQSQR